ncbi:hypothetical protein [Umezawaea sp.]
MTVVPRVVDGDHAGHRADEHRHDVPLQVDDVHAAPGDRDPPPDGSP